MLEHVKLSYMLMIDGHIIQCKVGNPSLMPAWTFFLACDSSPFGLLEAPGLSESFHRAGLPLHIRAG